MEPDDLYGLPLERFTEERNALSKGLRNDGRRDEAAEVSTLRKPSVAAWAVNQLVRTQRRDVAALFEAGDALRDAQSRLLAGRGEAGALREAVEAERAAVDQLTEKARGLLSSRGHELTPAALERVFDTLNAAALDEDSRAQVRRGCLERELHHVGLGALQAGSAGSARGRERRSASKRPAGRDRNETGRAPQTGLEAAREAEAEARRRAERAAEELKAARSRRDRAANSLRDAEEVFRGAEEQVGRTEQAAAQAVRELHELRRSRERG